MTINNMDFLPRKVILYEISRWLLSIDKQILRRTNNKFYKLFSYEKIVLNVGVP